MWILLLTLFAGPDTHAFEANHLYAFLGAGGSSYAGHRPAASFEYLRLGEQPVPVLGIRVDRTFGDPAATMVTAPVSLLLSGHAPLQLRLFVAPGARFTPGRTDFALLAGIGRWFELGSGWLLIPGISVDITEREATSFYGLQVGKSF